MKKFSRLVLIGALASALAYAEPCPEGQFCFSVDMKSVPDAFTQTICQESEHMKMCRTAVWVPVATTSIYLDINSYVIDEEDVFVSYRFISTTAEYDTTVVNVRFDCERALYKNMWYENFVQAKLVQRGIFTGKPKPVLDGGPDIIKLFYRACGAHDVIVKGT